LRRHGGSQFCLLFLHFKIIFATHSGLKTVIYRVLE
jgi:hypothetical protein